MQQSHSPAKNHQSQVRQGIAFPREANFDVSPAAEFKMRASMGSCHTSGRRPCGGRTWNVASAAQATGATVPSGGARTVFRRLMAGTQAAQLAGQSMRANFDPAARARFACRDAT